MIRRIVRRLLKPMRGKPKRQPFFEWLLKQAELGMSVGTGSGVERSGELVACEVVESRVSVESPICVFDVGANRGDYTRMLLERWADRKLAIHAFEPSERLFRQLEVVVPDPRVRKNRVALGDRVGTAILYTNPDHPGLGSLFDRHLDHLGKRLGHSEEVTLMTIDGYCRQQHVKCVDLLKLDIEGNELSALHGARTMLEEGRIDAIQFEFGGANVDSRTYFRDFWELLSPGFQLYRILQHGLYRIGHYHERLELFSCTNFLALRRSS
jgi:FkbM family methyltransferase